MRLPDLLGRHRDRLAAERPRPRSAVTCQIKIVGFDEDKNTLQGIKNGEIVGTIVQNPYKYGYESVRILASLVKGDDSVLKNHKNIDKNNNIFIMHRVIMPQAEDLSIDGQTVRTLFVDDFYELTKKLKGT